MPKITKIEIFKADIPFKFSFSHSLHERASSESIFLKLTLENNITGFGECLPRSYVTGNTTESVFSELKKYLPGLKGLALDGSDNSVNLVKELENIEHEARCAVELALLDCIGKISGKPVHDILGKTVNRTFNCSGVISAGSLLKSAATAVYFGLNGYRFIKIKTGSKNDVSRARLVRRILKDADIRIDANGAWDVVTALDNIENMRPFNISCIEQPTPKDDLGAMQEVADFCPEPVMADESLCTKEDASELARTRACDMFNVRLSKCGGLFRSLEIIKIAEDNGIGYQIGCHVGESGILSAAAIHLAAVAKDLKYFEGGYSRMILKEDVIEEDLTPRRGVGYTLNGPGLGVNVREDILKKYSKGEAVII